MARARRARWAAALAALALAGCATEAPAPTAPGQQQRGRVVTVIDGDTIKVELDGRTDTVRLLGIDTPESRRPQTPVECGSKKAAATLRRLLLDRNVTIRPTFAHHIFAGVLLNRANPLLSGS